MKPPPHPSSPSARLSQSLNGTWEIAPGEAHPPAAGWEQRVPVPALVDAASPPYRWQDHLYHWYRRTFIPSSPFASELAFLRIEQAMYGTSVYVNGTRIGGDCACYTSQEYDVSSHVIFGKENELLVRVGLKETLPPESAVGKDQERNEFVPGIWGDVVLVMSGNPRIRLVQTIPNVRKALVEARFWITNSGPRDLTAELRALVSEKVSRTKASDPATTRVSVPAAGECTVTLDLPIHAPSLWSPENPFLYTVDAECLLDGKATDAVSTSFGLREFAIRDGDFLLNGKKIVLRGGNIALHRFFSDPDRGSLPWDMAWVKKLLIDIPREHNFNFFRNHLGQLYNRWYDVADEHGMLLQNEWQFWTTSGTREQIEKEFTRWLEDNWNHPSIIIWDPLNESTDEVVQHQIVPRMKTIDPTRPWESVDFVEQHPYIYSLGPVLIDRRFGFTEALERIERCATPSMINEFLWWWLDRKGNPTALTREVMTRWLGNDPPPSDIIAHQSFLASELVELFRRMRVDAIQPFVYLSNNDGPTGDWFLGDIRELRPKPVLQALKNALAPFGISCELWDRHCTAQEQRTVRMFLFNDTQEPQSGTIRWGVVDPDGVWLSAREEAVEINPCDTVILPVPVMLPDRSGAFTIRAEIRRGNGPCVAYSEKRVFVLEEPHVAPHLRNRPCAILADQPGIHEFLLSAGVDAVPVRDVDLGRCTTLVVGEGMIAGGRYQARIGAITKFLQQGNSVILIEPEFDVTEPETLNVALGVELSVVRREDADRGGYDSYIFAEDLSHPLWNGLLPEHLKMFNGGYGGEVVSQHTVTPNVAQHVLARCGLQLAVVAVAELPVGPGKVIISRLQVRGRLMPGTGPDELFARRVDPVLRQYMLNLLAYASGSQEQPK